MKGLVWSVQLKSEESIWKGHFCKFKNLWDINEYIQKLMEQMWNKAKSCHRFSSSFRDEGEPPQISSTRSWNDYPCSSKNVIWWWWIAADIKISCSSFCFPDFSLRISQDFSFCSSASCSCDDLSNSSFRFSFTIKIIVSRFFLGISLLLKLFLVSEREETRNWNLWDPFNYKNKHS